MDKLIKETNDSIPYVLAGNKCDLSNKREVEEGDALKFCNDNNIDFMETSAKQNINVMECINNFIKNIVNSDIFIRNISFALSSPYSDQRKTINKNEKCC